MRVNAVEYDEAHTDVIGNVSETYPGNSYAIVHHMKMAWWHKRRALGHPSEKDVLFKLFGKQSTTVNYTCRNWVWVISNNDAVIYLMWSRKGLKWEFNQKETKSEMALLGLMADIITAMCKLTPIRMETEEELTWINERTN